MTGLTVVTCIITCKVLIHNYSQSVINTFTSVSNYVLLLVKVLMTV